VFREVGAAAVKATMASKSPFDDPKEIDRRRLFIPAQPEEVLLPAFATFYGALDRYLLCTAKPISRSQWKGGFGAHSGPSRGDPCRRAFHAIEASKAAVCNVRNTSAPAVHSGVDLRHVGRNPETLRSRWPWGISPRIRSRISDASGQSGPEYSKSVWRRSSSPSGHRFQ
jgi:hypothetical protein